tara:strand:+ start:1401 stop:1733 length:333 start_codon:yes stop_codon:yes gene_type:complete
MNLQRRIWESKIRNLPKNTLSESEENKDLFVKKGKKIGKYGQYTLYKYKKNYLALKNNGSWAELGDIDNIKKYQKKFQRPGAAGRFKGLGGAGKLSAFNDPDLFKLLGLS